MLEKQRFRGHLQFVPNIELLGGEQVLLAARIARDLAECRGGSTCDPMGAMTITYCADRDICQPGLNFEAYLQQQLPPIVLQAAYAIDQYYGTEAYLAD